VNGTITYPNPMTSVPVTVDTTKFDLISWWSKDYRYLIELWDTYSQTLTRYKHHFNFCINGEAESILEPGVKTSLMERLEQLSILSRLVQSIGQTPDASITVKIDPISSYKLVGDDTIHHTIDHVPLLFQQMSKIGLIHAHISFVQLDLGTRLPARLRKMKSRIVFIEQRSSEDQLNILDRFVFPYCRQYGIRLETCMSMIMPLVNRLKLTDTKPLLVQGACLGAETLSKIFNARIDEKNQTGKSDDRHCTCYPHRDVGSKKNPCIHGCRYCFVNPLIYDF
jgi:hypothetical protein